MLRYVEPHAIEFAYCGEYLLAGGQQGEIAYQDKSLMLLPIADNTAALPIDCNTM